MGRRPKVQVVNAGQESNLIDDLVSHFGKDIIFSFDLEEGDKNVPHLSTGSIGTDIALGGYGLPFGKVVELYGKESAGKSTLTLNIIAQTQKAGHSALYIDTEHAIDVLYARKIGVDLSKEKLLISQPDNLEQCLELIEVVAKIGKTKLICLDSLAGIAPKAELEGTIYDQQVGVVQRLMAKFFRMTIPVLDQNKVTLLITNQMRANIGVMFGPTITTYGGNAMRHHCSIRMEIARIEDIRQGETKIGQRSRVRITKNKCSAPHKEAEIVILYARGISAYDEVKEIGVDIGSVQQNGNFLKFQEHNLGNGRENVNNFLKENPLIFTQIKEDIMKKIALSM